MRRFSTVILVAVLSSSVGTAVLADDSRAVFEMEIPANIDDVWTAFTTTKGLKSWMAPLVEVDFKVGGIMKANYNSKGKIGDATTIENTILSFDTKRMLSLKATKFPKGFPFVAVARNTWSVFYFSKVSASRTKITVVGLGYTEDAQSQKMRAFFDTANKYSLNKLAEALKNQQKQK